MIMIIWKGASLAYRCIYKTLSLAIGLTDECSVAADCGKDEVTHSPRDEGGENNIDGTAN